MIIPLLLIAGVAGTAAFHNRNAAVSVSPDKKSSVLSDNAKRIIAARNKNLGAKSIVTIEDAAARDKLQAAKDSEKFQREGASVSVYAAAGAKAAGPLAPIGFVIGGVVGLIKARSDAGQSIAPNITDPTAGALRPRVQIHSLFSKHNP